MPALPVSRVLPAPNVGFSTAFSNCAAKDQPNPATGQTDHHYLPLIRVRDMIDSVNAITAWVPDSLGNVVYSADGSHLWVQKTPDKILVSGIIGWPPDTSLAGVTISDQYQIGRDATSLPAQQSTLWDYMPICTVPAQHSADGNIYKAYGGLRLKKFLDAFQKNDSNGSAIQNTFSLCNQDFTSPMAAIANAVVQVLTPGCVQYPLVDTNSAAPGIQPECQVVDRIPCDKPGMDTCLQNGYEEYYRPECIDSSTGLPLDPANPAIDNIPDTARPCWYLYYDSDPNRGCLSEYMHQRITVLRPRGTNAPAGTVLDLKCLTCPASNPDCSVAGH